MENISNDIFLYHTTDIATAYKIICDGVIFGFPNVFLSPNQWAHGNKYGNVCFKFELAHLATNHEMIKIPDEKYPHINKYFLKQNAKTTQLPTYEIETIRESSANCEIQVDNSLSINQCSGVIMCKGAANPKNKATIQNSLIASRKFIALIFDKHIKDELDFYKQWFINLDATDLWINTITNLYYLNRNKRDSENLGNALDILLDNHLIQLGPEAIKEAVRIFEDEIRIHLNLIKV